MNTSNTYNATDNSIEAFLVGIREETGEEGIVTLATTLYNIYCMFCEEEGYTPLTKATFGRRIKKFPGVESQKQTKGVVYRILPSSVSGDSAGN